MRTAAESILSLAIAALSEAGLPVQPADVAFSVDELPVVLAINPSQEPGESGTLDSDEWVCRLELHILSLNPAQIDALHLQAHAALQDNAALMEATSDDTARSLGYGQGESVGADYTYQRRIAPYQFKTLVPTGQI